jgi:hypothetical protein
MLSGVQLLIFAVAYAVWGPYVKMAACRPQNRSNRENKKKLSFIEIAPAVTKRALLMDDHALT